MGIVDWDLIWNNEMITTFRSRHDSGQFWDEVAARGGDVDLPAEITRRQLDIISPSKDKSILEIGPGQGRLTIPLARSSSHLTAVDPSAVMIERLLKRASDEGIDNIRSINLNWKDVEPSMIDGSPDIIVGSYSLFMMDISVQLRRMSDLASERVLLFLPGDPRIPPEIKHIIFGSDATSGMCDHVILFNILHGSGIDANVEMMSYKSRRTFYSPDEAVRELSMFYNVPENRISRFREHMIGSLIEEGGRYVLERDRRTAAIWWWTG